MISIITATTMQRSYDLDITIKDNKTGVYVRIPVTPEAISLDDGDAKASTVEILNLGDIDFLNGVELDAVNWSSIFPVRYDPSYCKYSDLKTPLEYKDIISTWKQSGASLQLIIPALGINKTMYVKSFKGNVEGWELDLNYDIQLKEYKIIRPLLLDSANPVISTAQTVTLESRAPVPETAAPTTYTVQSGDTLSYIAKKTGVTPWNTIYDKNKSVIGANPNTIYPGQVLTL